MGKRFDGISPEQAEFISKQPLFFVATAQETGRINLSPKGMDTLRVMHANQVIWLNLTGSGNETATHLYTHPRITLMFCAFEGKPMILRLYGKARVYHPRHQEFQKLERHFPQIPGARQIVDVEIDLVQTSCGFGVPLMDYRGQRDTLVRWAENKGESGLKDYWEERNSSSLDGHTTHIFKDSSEG